MPYITVDGERVNVPAGMTDPAQLKALASEYRQRKAAVGDMGTVERFARGAAAGAGNLGRNVANVALPRSLEPQWATREGIQRAQALQEPLMQTGAGKAGRFAGEVLATAPVGGLVGMGAKAALGAGRLAALAAGGAGQGAAEGFLTSGPGDRLGGAAVGAAGGAILPGVVGKLGRVAARGVDPSAAAKQLMRQGVDLTPGQMNPTGAMAQLESAAQSLPGVGPAIQGARQQAQDQWAGVARRQGLAPGATDARDLDAVYTGYEQAYDVPKGYPVQPRIVRTAGGDVPLASFPKVRGAFEQAARNPQVMADTAKRKQVNSWLQNQLTTLPSAGKGATLLDSADLLKLRSNIRDQIRTYGKGASPDLERVRLLEGAERSVTEALESQLPKRAMDALGATDKQYAQYKILEDAYRASGDQLAGLTPAKLSQAVKNATPAGVYARGGGGPLRKLAQLGRLTFQEQTPPTGARLAVLGAGPVAGTLAGLTGAGAAPAVLAGLGAVGAPAALTLTKTGRKLAGGQTKLQQVAQRKSAALRRKAGRSGRAAARAGAYATGAAATGELYRED